MKDYIEPKKVAQPVRIKIGNIKSSREFLGLNIAMTNSMDFLFGTNLGRLSFLDSAKDMARGNWYELPYPINNFYGLLQKLGWDIGAPVHDIRTLEKVGEMGVCSMPDEMGDFSIYIKDTNDLPLKIGFRGVDIFNIERSMIDRALAKCYFIGGEVEETEYFTTLHDGKGKEINSIGKNKLLLDKCAGRAIEEAFEYNEELALEWLKTSTGLPFEINKKIKSVCYSNGFDVDYIGITLFASCQFQVKFQNGTVLLKKAEVWFEKEKKEWHAQLLNK